MANYRQVYMSFWSDPKVDDDFTPEDKYFYLYLLTNPHTNICGCYEISTRQMERETGYNRDTLRRLLERMESTHGVVRYDASTKEVLLVNWYKYNWTKSEKLVRGVSEVAQSIKSAQFRDYIFSRLNQIAEGVSIPYGYPMETSDTVPITVTIPITAPNTSTVPSTEGDCKGETEKGTVISLPLNDGSEFRITHDDIDGWADLYPAVDILQELRKMRGWCDANPRKRKTKNGIRRFIASWLAREQDRGGTSARRAHPDSGSGRGNELLDMIARGDFDDSC